MATNTARLGMQLTSRALLGLLSVGGTLRHSFGETRTEKDIQQHTSQTKQFQPPQLGLHAGHQTATQGQTDCEMQQWIRLSRVIGHRVLPALHDRFFSWWIRLAHFASGITAMHFNSTAMAVGKAPTSTVVRQGFGSMALK